MINWDSPLLPLSVATVLLIGIFIDAPRDTGRPLRIGWLQLDEGASHLAHFAIAILRPALND